MLSPYQLPYFVRYFDGIDAAVSARLSRNVPASETTLTEEFLALMDLKSQRREKSLTYGVDDLQTDIAFPGDLLDVDFTISAHQHGSRFEAYVSQADFGLILEYRNTILPALDWNAAYLMQAKRLFHDRTGAYSVRSEFGSTSVEQDKRIKALARVLGSNGVRYCLYMPQPADYDANSTSAIRAFHSYNLSREIYDFALGLALHEAIRKAGGINAGMWIADVDASRKTAADVHNVAFEAINPLTWFILQHFGQFSSRHTGRMQLNQNLGQLAISGDRISKIAAGDAKAAQELIDELGGDARDEGVDPLRMKVLPKYSVTIRISSGPPEGLDIPIFRDGRE
jgi:hypothetical protein